MDIVNRMILHDDSSNQGFFLPGGGGGGGRACVQGKKKCGQEIQSNNSHK